MRTALLVALLAASVAATTASSAQAQTSDEVRRSGEGESCLKTNDCEAPLLCIAQSCRPPMKSGLGESCARTADCEGTLRCIQMACTADASLPTPALQRPAASNPDRRAKGQMLVAVGASVFAVGVGLLAGGFYADGQHEEAENEALCGPGSAPGCTSLSLVERQRIANDAKLHRDVSHVLFGLGGTAMAAGLATGIVGAVLWGKNPASRDPGAPEVSIGPWQPNVHTMGVQAGLSF